MHDGTMVLSAYDGVPTEVLRARAGAARLVALHRCGSTMDAAHDLAAAAAAHGTVVVAEEQDMGRGRTGKTWTSPRGAGVWVSVVLRPSPMLQGGVLSLRTGLELAERLDTLAAGTVQLKWPNDLYLPAGKLAGILTEARWRGEQLEWIVVGVGVNVRPSRHDVATASLDESATCAEVLVAVVRAVLAAGAAQGALSDDELGRYASRDVAVGREIVEPVCGIMRGISAAGELLVETPDGDAVAVAGSLVFRTP